MQKFSTVDLLRDIKTVTMAADRQPVAITQHRKARYVLMTYDDFEAMKQKSDPRRAYGANEAPRTGSANRSRTGPADTGGK
ncbi:type II toxin-antitoxin system Phd/YefM family antitoxin [Rhizobium calliandrae]|uniref:Type II toxin-antitoxin system Phd/YefM family antitoxin n=1 Tax=Rhizobium calliandrae TaxID=1312182 RepID=A0ABT7KQA3_9HYPH|nr:type II toxin-antitoxin system Phd/YefM family antitoxin [Rhizobium calliandrae]MDL2410621.1 type II toxin-antitoxin system Phd/YefM family antitoxin [Rhizobium calliandrae]